MELKPRVTVVTACLPAAAAFLPEAAESILRARAYVELEWIVVLDGPAPDDFIYPEADLVLEMPRQRGVSVARNFGLSKASAPLLVNLDADDEIQGEGLLKAVEYLEDNLDLGWVALNRLLVSGERTVHWHGCQAWPAGEVAATWSAPMAFHSNTLVVRTAEVLAVGGWPALPACQDLALCLLLSERSAGESLQHVLIHYRAWDGQHTASESFRIEQALAYGFIEEILGRVRAEAGRGPIVAPAALGGLGAKPLP